jgi:hypothetical protein
MKGSRRPVRDANSAPRPPLRLAGAAKERSLVGLKAASLGMTTLRWVVSVRSQGLCGGERIIQESVSLTAADGPSLNLGGQAEQEERGAT